MENEESNGNGAVNVGSEYAEAGYGDILRRKGLKRSSDEFSGSCPYFIPLEFQASTDGAQPPAAKKRKADGSVVVKNSLQRLNEMRPGLVYTEIESRGPAHCREFVISVEVNGVTYEGVGGSKQLAKSAAAEKALAVLLPIVVPSIPSAPASPKEGVTPSSGGGDLDSPGGPTDRNPCMILNERSPGLKYEIIEASGEPHARTFVISVTVGGRSFTGAGRSKKIAKSRAARAVLEEMYGYTFTVAPGAESVESDGTTAGLKVVSSDVADHIQELVEAKYDELVKDLPERFKKRKVLAGIVMATDETVISTAKVIAVTTGTKCADGESMSLQGVAVNDSHAEILARRCLKSFFYTQLQIAVEHPDGHADCILQLNETSTKYVVQPNVSFHLYISTSPCGDGRIFSSLENADASLFDDENGASPSDVDPHPNRISRGQLRSKIECGEGTIPVKDTGMNCQQTWDGVVGGERLLTMSCSDKVCRWNVLGLQGALLSIYMEPVYLSSVVIGSAYHSEHISRALYGRLTTTLGSLPSEYRLNHPALSTVTCPAARVAGKSPGHAGTWTLGEASMDVFSAMKGFADNVEQVEGPGRLSRVCKRELFRRFSGLWNRLAEVLKFNRDEDGKVLPQAPVYYDVAKGFAQRYKIAKFEMVKAFISGQLGKWVRHPLELDAFCLTDGK